MKTSSREPDAQLVAYLHGMNERLHDLVECEFVTDPDDFAAHLDDDTAFVEASLESIMTSMEVVPPEPINLNEVVDHACREFLLSVAFPVVITSSKDALLPGLPYSYELLLAAVLRALHVTAQVTGSGCELFVETSTDGRHSVVEIRSSKPLQPPSQTIGQHVVSLSNLIKGIGGSVTIEPTGEVMKMSLSFETRISSV